ncbi:MAG: N-methyl-L-tryptophan oxidase, partial [Chloroflexota bacterium]
MHAEEIVHSYDINANGVTVKTNRDTYQAARLIVTAGAWATKLLAELNLKLSVMRQVAFWFGTDDDKQFEPEKFPGYIVTTPQGEFYGFPVV